MTPIRPDPLDPAERQLADALARTAPPSGPSSELDATILASARDAARHAAPDTAGGAPASVQPAAANAGQRRRRRTPAWLRGGAVAATLVIAFGVAWQMRPQFGPTSADEAPAAVTAAPQAADAAASPEAVQTRRPPAARRTPGPAGQAGHAEPTPPRPGTSIPGAAAGSAAAQAEANRSAAASREAAKAAADRVLSERQAKAPAPAPSIAPDQPEPAAAPPAPPPAPSPARARALATEPPSRAAAPRPATPVPAASAADTRAEAHDESGVDQPLDDIPPASVESPAVREAWLARIRELVASERYGEARDSFGEFQRRYPDAPVPEDLRALLGGE
jgi:hypothetical protein